MTPFEPAGDKARWRYAYEVLTGASVGQVVSYAELGRAMTLDPDDERHAIQMAVRRAAREYEEVDLRAIEAVPNVGYRVVEAREHLALARRHQRRASTALKRGQSKVVNVDFNQIDGETRKAFEVVAQAFQMQRDLTRRLDVRSRKLEGLVAEFKAQQETTNEDHAERLARMEALLHKHGISEDDNANVD